MHRQIGRRLGKDLRFREDYATMYKGPLVKEEPHRDANGNLLDQPFVQRARSQPTISIRAPLAEKAPLSKSEPGISIGGPSDERHAHQEIVEDVKEEMRRYYVFIPGHDENELDLENRPMEPPFSLLDPLTQYLLLVEGILEDGPSYFKTHPNRIRGYPKKVLKRLLARDLQNERHLKADQRLQSNSGTLDRGYSKRKIPKVSFRWYLPDLSDIREDSEDSSWTSISFGSDEEPPHVDSGPRSGGIPIPADAPESSTPDMAFSYANGWAREKVLEWEKKNGHGSNAGASSQNEVGQGIGDAANFGEE
ncbi:unnamed protein product [Caenorhabditis brenneri]